MTIHHNEVGNVWEDPAPTQSWSVYVLKEFVFFLNYQCNLFGLVHVEAIYFVTVSYANIFITQHLVIFLWATWHWFQYMINFVSVLNHIPNFRLGRKPSQIPSWHHLLHIFRNNVLYTLYPHVSTGLKSVSLSNERQTKLHSDKTRNHPPKLTSL